MLAAAFHIDDGAFTKLSVAYTLTELVAAVVLDHRRPHPLMADRTTYRSAQAHLFHTLFRQLADKARRAMVNLFTIQTAGFRVGQRQFLHRAGYTNVGQTAFFFQTPAFIQRHLAWEHTLFHTDNKHLRELQAFRRVQRHQLHCILPGIRLPLARFQRRMGEECLQRH